ncbi:SNF4/AMP-activated protein kinase gamma subunit [Fasciola gigantica]|uniref:SNF4/AMP-activated protein kinase gamma subunit n=1 Tax=Fasciola gigantica TaxID=46835 RepID=A0A504Z1S6_FASGI|nr:SNF4/AMP-activated protein kinase gamma subunit [Fasciola gigantica]
MLTITDFIKILVNDYGKHDGIMDDYGNSTITKWRSMDKSTENQSLISVSPESNLYDAARTLTKYRYHRLPIIDHVYGNPLYILTHKRILNYLHLNRNVLPQDTFMSKSLEDLRLGTYMPNVHTISKEAPIIDALRLFVEHHVSCLPVVDSENHLVELYAKFDAFNLAVTRTYHNLDETIYNALGFHRANRERYPRPMTCLKTATLNFVIERMVNSGIHRLVIVDSKNRLEGIISLSDILRFIVQSNTKSNTREENHLRVPTHS